MVYYLVYKKNASSNQVSEPSPDLTLRSEVQAMIRYLFHKVTFFTWSVILYKFYI